MAQTRVFHKINNVAMHHIFDSPTGPVARDLFKRGIRVQSRARKNLGGATGSGPKRVDTGLLRSTVFNELVTNGPQLRVRIGTRVFYGIYVHDGTGIYGPKGTRIYPVNGKFLVWKSSAYGAKKGKYAGYAFATSTKGMKPNPFLKEALPAASLKVSA